MSINTNFHIGPYILIKNSKKLEDNFIKSCSNKKCEKYGEEIRNGKHCNECGSIIVKNNFPTEEYINCNDLLEENKWDNAFWEITDEGGPISEDEILLIENGRSEGKNIPKELDPTDCIQEISETTSIEALDYFNDKYKKHIAFFENTFGKNNVKVGFGGFVHYS